MDLNDTQQKIIKLLLEDHQLSAVKLAEKIGVASRNIENNIKKLKEYGILIRDHWGRSFLGFFFTKKMPQNSVPNGITDLKKFQYFVLISHSYEQLLFRNW